MNCTNARVVHTATSHEFARKWHGGYVRGSLVDVLHTVHSDGGQETLCREHPVLPPDDTIYPSPSCRWGMPSPRSRHGLRAYVSGIRSTTAERVRPNRLTR
jgi:hypothetical protein